MTDKERMLAGLLYRPGVPELKEGMRRARVLTRLFNNTTEEQLAYRTELLRELFKSVGEHIYIEPDFRCDYGKNISVGNDFYANYGCVILDVCEVVIGDNVMFGPGVHVYAAGHPLDAEVRVSGLEIGKPVRIGNGVWVGGATVINAGVSIGCNTIIGSGSVVTKDISANVIAAGNPCRVIREITEDDRMYWKKLEREYYEQQ